MKQYREFFLNDDSSRQLYALVSSLVFTLGQCSMFQGFHGATKTDRRFFKSRLKELMVEGFISRVAPDPGLDDLHGPRIQLISDEKRYEPNDEGESYAIPQENHKEIGLFRVVSVSALIIFDSDFTTGAF
jgi:hypothetical protein